MAGAGRIRAWRFVALPAAAVAGALWLTRDGADPLDACLGEWQLDRRRGDEMVDVVEVQGRPIALWCIEHAHTVSFIGTVLERMPPEGRLPVDRLSAAGADMPGGGAGTGDAEAATLIDGAVLARYGCRVRGDGLPPPVAARMPVVERVGVPRAALDCGG